MSYQVIIPKPVQKQLDGIPDAIYDRIIKQIKMLEEYPRPRGCVKLKGYETEYRIRIGNYRIRYEICDQKYVVIILHCKHRKSVYKD